jgi:hypothetical protein
MRDRGEIRNTADFEKKLTELANLIQQETLSQRTPLLTFSEGQLLESDAIRTFIESARLDIEAALGETERLSNSIRAHNRILSENYFDALEAAISSLESETTSYELLDKQRFIGFTGILKRFVFSGSITTPGADINNPAISSLFIDNRGNEESSYSPPTNGDRGLHLSVIDVNGEEANLFNKVEILTDSTTPQTALNTSTSDNIPINAIDGDRDKAWRNSVLLTEYPDFCRLIFSPAFTGARRVTALVIDPLSDIAMKIVSISYIDSGGREIDLSLGTGSVGSASPLFNRSGFLGDILPRNEDWIISNKKVIIPVGDIIVRKFIITLQQDTGNDGDFFYDESDIGNWTGNIPIEEILNSKLNRGFPEESRIPAEFGYIGEKEETRRQARFAEYVFGFKDISTITREYVKNGLFVPEPFESPFPPNILGLYTDAEFPANERSDIEFLLRKENYDENDLLLDVETLPLLPYGSSSIDERLLFTESQVDPVIQDTATLRFYPNFSSSFNVYKESTLLTIGTDYTVSVNDGSSFETSLPPSGTVGDPPKCLVRVISPQSGGVYSVSYTPLVSTSSAGGEVWLNATHTVRLGRDQTYVFSNERSVFPVNKCKMGLQIIFRSNTLNSRISPYLREAVLLGG